MRLFLVTLLAIALDYIPIEFSGIYQAMLVVGATMAILQDLAEIKKGEK